jgi:hypothetical protein
MFAVSVTAALFEHKKLGTPPSMSPTTPQPSQGALKDILHQPSLASLRVITLARFRWLKDHIHPRKLPPRTIASRDI